MTWNNLDSDMLIHVDKDVTSKWWMIHVERMDSSTYKKCPVLGIKLTYHPYQNDIEIKNDSIENDGSHSHSWTVIIREINKYFNELIDENEKSNHSEEMIIDTGKFVATKRTIAKYILVVDGDGCGSFSFTVSKTMIRMQRHRDLHRQTDGAMQWNILSFCVMPR